MQSITGKRTSIATRSGTEKDDARQIQRSLLPLGTLTGDCFEIAYRFSPHGEVGGDFADFFHLPGDQVGLYLGDVVGKGLSAAMYAALVMGMIRGIHKTGAGHRGALWPFSMNDCSCVPWRDGILQRSTPSSICIPTG